MRKLMKTASVAAMSLSLFAIPVEAAVISANSAVVYELPGEGSTTLYGPTGPGPSAAGYTNSNGVGAAGGYGQASYGGLHASAAAIINAGAAGGTTQMRGQGGALWLDQVTISNSALTGQQAFATASFSLSGGLSSASDLPPGGAVANSTVVARVQVNGSNVFRAKGQLVSQNGVITIDNLEVEGELNGVFYELDPGVSLSGLYTFDIPFTFGTSFQLFTTLDTFTQAVATEGKRASAHSNFGSSAYWGGISNVHLADGTILTGYGVGSDSGYNWGNAYLTETPPPPPVAGVPEPMTLSLLGAGLGGMARLRLASAWQAWLRRRQPSLRFGPASRG